MAKLACAVSFLRETGKIWMVVKTERSEVLAVQIEKKKELIKEKKIFLEEKKSIRDFSLKLATSFSY